MSQIECHTAFLHSPKEEGEQSKRAHKVSSKGKEYPVSDCEVVLAPDKLNEVFNILIGEEVVSVGLSQQEDELFHPIGIRDPVEVKHLQVDRLLIDA